MIPKASDYRQWCTMVKSTSMTWDFIEQRIYAYRRRHDQDVDRRVRWYLRLAAKSLGIVLDTRKTRFRWVDFDDTSIVVPELSPVSFGIVGEPPESTPICIRHLPRTRVNMAAGSLYFTMVFFYDQEAKTCYVVKGPSGRGLSIVYKGPLLAIHLPSLFQEMLKAWSHADSFAKQEVLLSVCTQGRMRKVLKSLSLDRLFWRGTWLFPGQ